MKVTREEFEALKRKVAILEASLGDLWSQTSKARLNTMVFGPGDNDYGRSPELDAFKCLGESWRK